jgi:hypothetical protein
MNIDEVFTSKYISAADLKGKTPVVTITQIEMAKMQDGQSKPCIYINNNPKGLVLNKTNAKMIAKLYGAETDTWIGKKIKLITAWVEYQGDTVQAIRIRPPNDVEYTAEEAQAPLGGPPPGHPAAMDDLNDDPFA